MAIKRVYAAGNKPIPPKTAAVCFWTGWFRMNKIERQKIPTERMKERKRRKDGRKQLTNNKEGTFLFSG